MGFSNELDLNIYKKGINNEDVKIIQYALKKEGVFTYDSITSYYGNITKNAVITFQKRYGLTPDGIVGSKTIDKMENLGLLEGHDTLQVSRGNVQRGYGAYLDWWSQVRHMLERNQTILTVQDLTTKLRFKVKVTAGSNHADVETLTLEDTKMMKNIWGGFSWERRPVLVMFNGQTIAASMTAMPHAGVEDKPAGKHVDNRSDGYGYGYNYDFVKGNDMSGHVDIHFKNSTRHKDDKQDNKHQEAIKKAAGIIE